MTQYLLAVHHAGAFPDMPVEEWQQSFADVGVLNDKMMEAGAFVFAGGLLPQSATVVRKSGDDFLITDGPYTETKEWIAGFGILDCDTLEQAIELARRNPMSWAGRIELRPIHSMGGPED